MIVLFVGLLFLVGASFNVLLLIRMDVRQMDFMDGILIGQVYYIVLPMLFFLLTGVVQISGLFLGYWLYDDLQGTAVILCGLFLLPLLRLLLPRSSLHAPDTSDPRMVWVMVCLFLATGVLSFALSGLGSGGHWQGNLDAAFGNPLFLPTKFAANIARNVVFAGLLYAVVVKRLRPASAITLGAVLALFDLATTFNRITAVYLLLMVLLILKNRPWRMLLVGGASLTALSLVSGWWPVFRGLATRQGYTIESFARAWDLTQRAQADTMGTLDTALNGVFESSNLVVLNWIVNNYGTQEQPHLVYAMFLRPLTVLLPGSIWPDRPTTMSVELGSAIAGVEGLALNSTVYGEAFANFGWFWPLGLAAFLAGAHLLFRSLSPQARVVQMMGAFVAIAFWRFDSSYLGCSAVMLGLVVAGLRLTRPPSRRQPVPLFQLLGDVR